MSAIPSRWFEDWRLVETQRTHGRTVIEADVAAFAGVTGDIDPPHMDAEYAKGTGYGQRLPHGQLIFVLAYGGRIPAQGSPAASHLG